MKPIRTPIEKFGNLLRHRLRNPFQTSKRKIMRFPQKPVMRIGLLFPHAYWALVF